MKCKVLFDFGIEIDASQVDTGRTDLFKRTWDAAKTVGTKEPKIYAVVEERLKELI